MGLPHLKKPPVHRVVIFQMAVTLVLCIGFFGVGPVSALSAFLGGSISWIPNSYLIFRFFSHSGAHAANQMVQDFYRGEAGKFVLTACGFTLAFTLVQPLDAITLFGAFILVQAVHWLSPLLLRSHR